MSIRVAYLGPKGTFAEKAAYSLAKLEKLDNAEFLPCKGLHSVVEHVANNICEAAVVPIENSVEGGVTATLDSLWKHSQLSIKKAIVLPIQHALISSGNIKEISEVLSHPQALAQCSGWLNRNLPNALQLPTYSTSEAVRMVQGSRFRAAIGAKLSRKQDDLNEIAFPINDIEGNCTRFVLLQNGESNQSGDIASFAFSLHANKPGSLLKVLTQIADLGLNMSRIESRPSKREMGEYVFFIDVEFQNDSNKLNKELRTILPALCERLVYFGSYTTYEQTY